MYAAFSYSLRIIFSPKIMIEKDYSYNLMGPGPTQPPIASPLYLVDLSWRVSWWIQSKIFVGIILCPKCFWSYFSGNSDDFMDLTVSRVIL